MEISEHTGFCSFVADVHAFYRQDCSKFALAVWWEALKPFDLGAVRDALNRHAINPDNGQFLPKPADIVRLIQGGTQDSALVAWAKVEKALRVVGPYQSVAFDDPVIHAVLADMGGWILLSDVKDNELPFKAKEFETRYRGYRTRGRLEQFPAKLTGICDRDNASAGFLTPRDVVLIGDESKAMRVLQQGAEAPLRIGKPVTFLPKNLAA